MAAASLVLGLAAAGTAAPPDLVLVSAKIWTGDPARPAAEALAVKDGRIVAVGTNAEIEKLKGAATVVVDGKGRRVVPGMIDCHTHMSMGGLNLLALDLRQDEGPGRLHAPGRGVREGQARGPVADGRRLGPRAVDAAAAADEGAARSGDGRPADLPGAPGRPHDGLQQPRAEARGHHEGDAQPARRSDREGRLRRADGRSQGRGHGPRLEGPPAPHEGGDRRRAARRGQARGEERRHLGAGPAGRPRWICRPGTRSGTRASSRRCA